MSEEGAIVDQAADRHKPPWALTETEVAQLMWAFTRGKTSVTNEECLTLCHWAAHRKRGALALHGVLTGHLVPVVVGTQVHVTVRSAAARAPA